jgi:hypothetical protein
VKRSKVSLGGATERIVGLIHAANQDLPYPGIAPAGLKRALRLRGPRTSSRAIAG